MFKGSLFSVLQSGSSGRHKATLSSEEVLAPSFDKRSPRNGGRSYLFDECTQNK